MILTQDCKWLDTIGIPKTILLEVAGNLQAFKRPDFGKPLYRKFSIKFPGGGGLFISNTFGVGENLFNLAKMVVLVLHEEAECKVETLKYIK